MLSLHELVAIKETHNERFLNLPGVTGVDVGYKYVHGKRTDAIAIRVMVGQKKSGLSDAEKIPSVIDGAPTDVIQRTFQLHDPSNRKKLSDIELMADATRYTTLKGGISIGPCRAVGGYVFVGTLGCIVRDKTNNDPLLLSNFHVMCIDNGWSVGDNMAQPGRVDGGQCPADVIGTLQRAALTGKVDAAVCSISGRTFACEIVDIGKVTGSATATLGMAVRKRGRTTGLTYGTVDSVNLTIKVDYGNGIGEKTLTGQIGVTPDTTKNAKFGDHGDSGSVVVNGSVEVVGLHFAGGDDGYGVANPIADVLDELKIKLCIPPAKTVLKDLKDGKRGTKETKNEFKEQKDAKNESKEQKDAKNEFKEQKDYKFERKEILKDGKPESDKLHKEMEKIADTGFDPVLPTPELPRPANIEERVAQLEAALGQITTFITAELRPDLAKGALKEEPDAE